MTMKTCHHCGATGEVEVFQGKESLLGLPSGWSQVQVALSGRAQPTISNVYLCAQHTDDLLRLVWLKAKPDHA